MPVRVIDTSSPSQVPETRNMAARLSLSSSSAHRRSKKTKQQPPQTKLCIALLDYNRENSNIEISVFVVDVLSGDHHNAAAGVLLSPNLRLDLEQLLPDYFKFCVLGSTLYMIYVVDDEPSLRDYWFVRKYDFHTDVDQDCTVQLKMSELDKVPRMHTYKLCPHAIPTPDGKRMLVFSADVPIPPSGEHHCAFELYTPPTPTQGGERGGGEWLKLPQISGNWTEEMRKSVWRKLGGSVQIESCAFLDQHVFLVQTDFGMFKLDLESLDKGWQVVMGGDLSGGAECINKSLLGNCFNFLVLGDGLWVSPSVIYNAKSAKTVDLVEEHARYYLTCHGKRPFRSFITRLVGGDEGERVCLVQVLKRKGPPQGIDLLIHVYTVDLFKKLMEDDKTLEHLPVGLGKHSTLSLNVPYFRRYIPQTNLSPFGAGTVRDCRYIKYATPAPMPPQSVPSPSSRIVFGTVPLAAYKHADPPIM